MTFPAKVTMVSDFLLFDTLPASQESRKQVRMRSRFAFPAS
jgi:hypothetical protein